MKLIIYFGVAEVAKALGWSTEKTHVYYKRGKFLEPAATVGGRPLWTKEQFESIIESIS